jgi:hypothetical protein
MSTLGWTMIKGKEGSMKLVHDEIMMGTISTGSQA